MSVQAINGKLYFMGEDCLTYQVIDADSIKCANRKGEYTYNATGLTPDQAQPIINQMAADGAAKRVRRAQEIQQLAQSIRRLGQSAENWGQQVTQQAQQYHAPQVQPISGYRAGGVTYTVVGDTLVGSNGVSYRRIGQSVIGSDGTTCQVVGQNLICR